MRSLILAAFALAAVAPSAALACGMRMKEAKVEINLADALDDIDAAEAPPKADKKPDAKVDDKKDAPKAPAPAAQS
jgi:hypothetical protein